MSKIKTVGHNPVLALGAVALAAAGEFAPTVAHGQTVSIDPTFATSTSTYVAPTGEMLAGIQNITVTRPLEIDGNTIQPNGYSIIFAGAISQNPSHLPNAVYNDAITVSGAGTTIFTGQTTFARGGVNLVVNSGGTVRFGDGTTVPSFNDTIYNPGGALIFGCSRHVYLYGYRAAPRRVGLGQL